MKAGLQEQLKQRLHRMKNECYLATEAVIRANEDVRARRDEWDLGTKTNVTVRDDGSVQLTGTSAAKMESTSSNGFITDLNNAKPLDVFAYELDEGIGTTYLTKVQLWLDRKNNGGQPVFDGFFKLQLYRIHSYVGLISAIDAWYVQPIGDPVVVNAASMASDQQLVDFNLTQSGDFPGEFIPGVLMDGSMRPQYGGDRRLLGQGMSPGILIQREDPLNARVVVAVLTAFGGSNTNYGLGRDSGLANKITTGGQGTLRHYIANNVAFSDQLGGPNPNTWSMSGGTGMIRGGFFLGSYGPSATGSLVLSGGQQLDLGASVSGTVEFVCRGSAPAGTSLVFQARVGGADPWVTVKDGQSPADVGLASSQTYLMQALFTANASGDVTPTLWAMGIMDRVVMDVTEIATLQGFSESVDLLSGEVKMAQVSCTLEHTGKKDFQDMATVLMSTYDFTQVEIRTYAAHADLTRDQWLLLHIWRVDDHEDSLTQLKLTLVSVLERMRGRYPLGAATLFGWMLKAANSDLSGGADFTKELSEASETGGTINFSVASSATEDQLGFTKPGVPNLQKWPTGNWSVQVNVTVANTNLFLSVAVARVNSSGTQQQISRFTPEQQCTSGVKTFQLQNLAWNAGAVGDRIKIVYRFRNNVASAQAVTIETGTTNTQVQAPWFPLTAQDPKRYDMQNIQAIYKDWRDVQVGLAERYRGAVPADTTTLLRKSVWDADGKRELERIAWAGRGIVIGSQGLVKFVPAFEPRQWSVARFPLQEITTLGASPGLRNRVPELFCGYGFDTVKKDDFAGEVQIVHANAKAKFGVSRIDNAVRKVEEETAKWFPDQGVALSAASPFVLSLATGQIVVRFRSHIARPEIDLGDAVLFETESFTMRDPNTAERICGFTVGFGIVIGIEGVWGEVFDVWVRSPADLFSLQSASVLRRPFEQPYVNAVVQPIVGEPQNAKVTLQAFPQTTTVYYYVHADGTTPPERDNPLWTQYTTALSVARSASAETLVSYWARYQGIVSPIFTARVPPDPRPQILTVTLDADSVGAMTATIQADGDTGSIRFVGRKTGFPSLADAQGQTAVNGRNLSQAVIDAATGSQMVIDPNAGEACYVTAVAYSRASAAGAEGPIANARFKIGLTLRRFIFTSGSSVQIPADWNAANNSIEGIGGGGGGAAGLTNTRGGGGGGGGEYRRTNNSALNPGQTYSYAIGGGGAGGVGSGSNGSNGGSTTFNTSTMIAANGAGGSGVTGGAGGTGGTGAGGNRNGGTGANGTVSTNGSGGGGGGGAGPTAGGGNGSGTTGGAGQANIWGSVGAGSGGSGGTPPTPVPGNPGNAQGGGGGGGACIPSAASNGGNGAGGVLVISWYA